MESKVNYTIVGFFVVALTLVIVITSFWLTDSNRKTYEPYLVYMQEAVSGLSEQAPVKFNGVNVGYVKQISLDPDNPQRVRLLLNIVKGTPITQSTTATLMAQGVTGITYIGLRATEADSPPLEKKPGQKYPVITSAPSLLVQLDTALRDLTTNMKAVTKIFYKTFDENNQQAIKQSLANIAVFSQTLANNSQAINASINHANQVLANMAQASKDLPKTMQQIKQTINSLNQSAVSFNAASQQALPEMIQLMNHLSVVITHLEQFSNQIENNPAALVRGVQRPPLGPGEK